MHTGLTRRARGVSLIELLVVLILIATLTGVAAPGWRLLLIDIRRGDATSLLQRVALRQEQFRLRHNRYAGDSEVVPAPPEGLGIVNTSQHYALSISASNGNYTAAATARAHSPQFDDEACRRFTLDNADRRLAYSAGGKPTSMECWPQ